MYTHTHIYIYVYIYAYMETLNPQGVAARGPLVLSANPRTLITQTRSTNYSRVGHTEQKPKPAGHKESKQAGPEGRAQQQACSSWQEERTYMSGLRVRLKAYELMASGLGFGL